MQYEKRVIAKLDSAYMAVPFHNGTEQLVAIGGERKGPVLLANLEGEVVERVCEGPGGTMTLAQVPGRTDQLLASMNMYSPNCGGDDAAIWSYTREEDGTWTARELLPLPYVHRFGFVRGADGAWWILACAIKDSCEYDDDWRSPGRVVAARVPERIEDFDAGNPLPSKILDPDQFKNHGFWAAPDASFALVTTDGGVFRYTPPASPEGEWEILRIHDQPTSDALLIDLDGDGKQEMVTFSPFHGDDLRVWRQDGDSWQLAWDDPDEHPFLHAIWGGVIGGKPTCVVSAREGGAELMMLRYEDGAYQLEDIEAGVCSMNAYAFHCDDGTDRIVSCNRTTTEVALYIL